ncbi:MAG: monovalent cation/H(+) antiporter subunit G [Eubacteriales bacterium]|nr:monovalent cation/H(+) antiporter subunit G [Eubacteriales bacterium]
MIFEWCRFAVAVVCFVIGILFMVLAVFGVNRFDRALNRMHAAALGDTLGILFVFLGLILMRGWSMDSLKLFLVILFFWMASPVSGHMISRLEATTDESLGEIQVIRKETEKAAGSGQAEAMGTENENGGGRE